VDETPLFSLVCYNAFVTSKDALRAVEHTDPFCEIGEDELRCPNVIIDTLMLVRLSHRLDFYCPRKGLSLKDTSVISHDLIRSRAEHPRGARLAKVIIYDLYRLDLALFPFPEPRLQPDGPE
jgi:hypothetical protein